MKFKIKTLLLMFVVFLACSYVGSWANAWLGLTQGSDLLGGIIFAFIPFTIFYIVWTNYVQKRAEAK